MSSFYPFPRLPIELRLQIWEMTVEPRTVDVQVSWMNGVHLRSATPVPAILHACREARNHGLYKKAFSEVDTSQEQRYVWLNLDIDLVDIGTSHFTYLKSVAPFIKWLKFERENTDEYFFHTESRQLKWFANVKEIHVVCADGFWRWGGTVDNGPHEWPCPAENLFFTDALDGWTARGMELETISRRLLKEARFASCGEAWSTDDSSD